MPCTALSLGDTVNHLQSIIVDISTKNARKSLIQTESQLIHNWSEFSKLPTSNCLATLIDKSTGKSWRRFTRLNFSRVQYGVESGAFEPPKILGQGPIACPHSTAVVLSGGGPRPHATYNLYVHRLYHPPNYPNFQGFCSKWTMGRSEWVMGRCDSVNRLGEIEIRPGWGRAGFVTESRKQ